MYRMRSRVRLVLGASFALLAVITGLLLWGSISPFSVAPDNEGLTRGYGGIQPRGGTESLGYVKAHALVVGIDHYPGSSLAGLAGVPVRDAAEVAHVLATRFGFSVTLLLDQQHPENIPLHEDKVDVLLPPDPKKGITKEWLLTQLRGLEVGQKDALLFYYAGHGLRKSGEVRAYLAPAGASSANDKNLIDLADVAAILKDHDAHHTLMILDCCFSGAALEPESGVVNRIDGLQPRLLRSGQGNNLSRVFSQRSFQIIAAGTGSEVVANETRREVDAYLRRYAALAPKMKGKYLGHSPFTAVLLQALRGLTGRSDGKLLASQLGYFMSDALVNDERIGARQAPRYGSIGGGDGDFVFLPMHDVLDPKLIAPLYLPSGRYSKLRETACAELTKYVLSFSTSESDLEGYNRGLSLTRNLVPHFAHLLAGNNADAQHGATVALAELASRYGEHVQEFSQVKRYMVTILKDAKNPDALRREAARCLGHLAQHASEDDGVVDSLRTWIEYRESSLNAYREQMKFRFEIQGPLQLPAPIQQKLEFVGTPEIPVDDAAVAARVRYLDQLRQRLEVVSPESLEAYASLHAQGRVFLERAKRAAAKGDTMRALISSGKAIGFSGFGRAEMEPPLRNQHTELLFHNSTDWLEATQLINDSWNEPGRLIWSSSSLVHHDKAVSAVSWSPDGRMLASGSHDSSIKLWDLQAGKRIRTFRGHTHGVRCLSFSPCGHLLASGSSDNTIKVWNVATGEGLMTLIGENDYSQIESLAFSSDGQTIVSGGRDRLVRLWDVRSGKQTSVFAGHTHWVSCVAFSPNGQLIASSSWDKTIRLWESATGRELRSIRGHTKFVRAVEFTPDGTQLVSGGWDKTVRVWNVKSGKLTQTLRGHESAVIAVAVSHDGATLASAGYDDTIRLWDRVSGKEQRSMKGHSECVRSIRFSLDDQMIASGSDDRTVRLWRTTNGNALDTSQKRSRSVSSVRFSPDGETIALSRSDGAIEFWRVATAQRVGDLPGQGHGVDDLAFSPNGDKLVSAGADKTVKIWDTKTGEELHSLADHTDQVNSVAISPDGKTVVSGGDDRTVVLWDLATGTARHMPNAHKERVSAVAFSPCGKTLVTGSADTVRFWDVPTATQIESLPQTLQASSSLCFSPNGQILASSFAQTITLLEWKTGTVLSTIQLVEPEPSALSFSPDGKTLAVGCGPLVRLFNTSLDEFTHILSGHSDHVTSVSISPDGETLVSGSRDGTIKLWDVSIGGQIHQYKGHRDEISALAISCDGEVLVSGSESNVIKIWSATTGAELRTLRGRNGHVTELALSPDASTLASAGDDSGITLWNVSTGQERVTLDGHSDGVSALVFAPTEKVLASAGKHDGSVRTWDIATGALITVFNCNDSNVASIGISPNGKLVAAGSNNAVKVWNLASRQELLTLDGHSSNVTFVRFSPDNRVLATGDNRGAVRLWHLSSGRRIHALEDPKVTDGDNSICALQFGPDDHTVFVSRLFYNAIEEWDTSSGKLRRSWPIPPVFHPKVVISPAGTSCANVSVDGTTIQLSAISGDRCLSCYLSSCYFYKQETLWTSSSDNLYRAASSDYLNLMPGRHIHVLKSTLASEEKRIALFNMYLSARNMASALLLALQLQRESDRNRAFEKLTDALVDLAKHDPSQTEAIASQLVARAPGFPNAYQVRGLALLYQGEFEYALNDLKTALTLQPHDPALLVNLARAHALHARAASDQSAKHRSIDLALQSLRRSVKIGWRDPKRFSADLDFEILHSDPRFLALIAGDYKLAVVRHLRESDRSEQRNTFRAVHDVQLNGGTLYRIELYGQHSANLTINIGKTSHAAGGAFYPRIGSRYELTIQTPRTGTYKIMLSSTHRGAFGLFVSESEVK